MQATGGSRIPLTLQPVGRRSLRSRFAGVDQRERRLRCDICGWTDDGGAGRTLPELTAHDCTDPRERRRRRWPVAVLAIAVLAAGGAAVLARDPEVLQPERAGPVRALVLSGSSLSYDEATGAAAALGWEATVYALPGIGFTRSTLDPEQNLVRSSRELLPTGALDLVVVQGGEADHATPRLVLTKAVLELVDVVEGSSAQLVLVGPIPGAQVPDSLRRVNDVLLAQAEARDVPYVDALGLGWRAGDPALPDLLAAELAAVTRS